MVQFCDIKTSVKITMQSYFITYQVTKGESN